MKLQVRMRPAFRYGHGINVCAFLTAGGLAFLAVSLQVMVKRIDEIIRRGTPS
jgi:hypothetical protein